MRISMSCSKSEAFATWAETRYVKATGSRLYDGLKPPVDLSDETVLKKSACRLTPGFLSRGAQDPIYCRASCRVCGKKVGNAPSSRDQFLEYLASHLRTSQKCQRIRAQRITSGTTSSNLLVGEETLEYRKTLEIETRLMEKDQKFWDLLKRWKDNLDLETLEYWSAYCYQDAADFDYRINRLTCTMSRLSKMGYLIYGPSSPLRKRDTSITEQDEQEWISMQEAMSLHIVVPSTPAKRLVSRFRIVNQSLSHPSS
jgi:hypothetical protein